MFEILKEDLKMVLLMALTILLTQTLFFMAFSYCMTGDCFVALRNFYGMMY